MSFWRERNATFLDAGVDAAASASAMLPRLRARSVGASPLVPSSDEVLEIDADADSRLVAKGRAGADLAARLVTVFEDVSASARRSPKGTL